MRDASLRSGGTSWVMEMLVRLVLTRAEYQFSGQEVGGELCRSTLPLCRTVFPRRLAVIRELHTAFGPCGCEERRKGD